MSCCRAACPQTAGKQGLKPAQSSPGSVLGEVEHTHQSKAMFVEQSPPSGPVGALFALLLGVRAANNRYRVGKLHGHVFILPPVAFPATPLLGSCSGSASVTLTP